MIRPSLQDGGSDRTNLAKTWRRRNQNTPAYRAPGSSLLSMLKCLRRPEGDEETLAPKVVSPQSVQPFYQHWPLDLNSPSIRLIRVRPDLSSDGQIQLEIRHASTNSTYICLSYVWGEDRANLSIRLAGRLFLVRHNLYAFLNSARKKSHICSEWLWIDALCIDQSNNSERSHQVQQMGHIFSHAVKVISWLGDEERIARFLRGRTEPLILDTSHIEDYRPGTSDFFASQYWRRAWITQEVGLARSITFMAGNEEIDRRKPSWEEERTDYPYLITFPVYFTNLSHQWKGRSLIYLLQFFSKKGCQNRCDRVFSLLGVCGEGSDLEVDYDISNDDLAKRVLKACSNNFCLCVIRLLHRVLNLSEPNPAVVEKQLFGTLSLTTRKSLHNSQVTVLKSLDSVVGSGNPMAVDIRMMALCQSELGRFSITILPGTCCRVQNSDNGSTLHYNRCEIVIEEKLYLTGREAIKRSHGCSVSYDRDAQTWNVIFPFATLVQLACMRDTIPLCKRGSDENVASVEAPDESGLRIYSGDDVYIEAPDLSLRMPGKPPTPSIRSLRSFKVQPYVDGRGQSRHCGVFVYDREDSKDAS